MKQHIAISAIGSDRTGMVHDLTKIVTDCSGSISESRMTALGSEFAVLLLVGGNWHSLAKLETELQKLATDTGLSIHIKRTEPRGPRTEMVPYSGRCRLPRPDGPRVGAVRILLGARHRYRWWRLATIRRRTPAHRCSQCR
ncbi:MAG: hypothetical protein IPG25_13870 [Proteobacteria bacterium]|nr:hypothetical protein [Pseudomonadota bacterium]